MNIIDSFFSYQFPTITYSYISIFSIIVFIEAIYQIPWRSISYYVSFKSFTSCFFRDTILWKRSIYRHVYIEYMYFFIQLLWKWDFKHSNFREYDVRIRCYWILIITIIYDAIGIRLTVVASKADEYKEEYWDDFSHWLVFLWKNLENVCIFPESSIIIQMNDGHFFICFNGIVQAYINYIFLS